MIMQNIKSKKIIICEALLLSLFTILITLNTLHAKYPGPDSSTKCKWGTGWRLCAQVVGHYDDLYHYGSAYHRSSVHIDWWALIWRDGPLHYCFQTDDYTLPGTTNAWEISRTLSCYSRFALTYSKQDFQSIGDWWTAEATAIVRASP
ncbi:MAG: hypothetical protein DRJ49_06660 [Thermoprotei archaeon]|nr:MAG: hypothetical protein DRJ49_06660 [Thermoprotei archaeon]